MKIEITEKQLELINESLLNEGGIRDINKLAKRYPKAEIYFHQDLDGVVSALGMKNYLIWMFYQKIFKLLMHLLFL